MAKWEIDSAHSSAQFKVKHLGIAWVTGDFFGIEGEISYDQDNAKSTKFSGTVDIESLTTGVPQRDGHLKGDDFFDVEKYPHMKFNSVEVTETNGNKGKVTGELTIKDTTKIIELDVEFNGVVEKPLQDGGSVEVASFTLETKIDRTEFGLNWNVELPNGAMMVGNDVFITVNIEALKSE